MVTDRYQGACYGYGVESSVPLTYLRLGSGSPLVVDEHDGSTNWSSCKQVLHWPARPDRPVEVRLHRLDEVVYALHIEDAGWYLIDVARPAISLPPGGWPVRREERLWGMPALLTFLHRGDLPLHGASIDIGGRAVILTGPSRHGKTTLAASFWKAGCRLLAEDLTCVAWRPRPVVFPGPAMLRVRLDMADLLGLPEVDELGRDEARAHYRLAGPRAEDPEPSPLEAIVLLDWWDGEVELTQVPPMEAIPDLWAVTFHLPDHEREQATFAALAELIDQVPVFRLRRPKRREDIELVLKTIETVVE